MKSIFRLLLLALGLSSTFLAWTKLRKISRLASELKSGAISSPSAPNRMEIGDQANEAIAKLLEARQISPGILKEFAEGGEIVKTAPRQDRALSRAPSGPASLGDTNSSRERIKISSTLDGGAGPKPGGAVMIDSKTGRRYEIQASASAADKAKRLVPKALSEFKPPAVLPEAGDLYSRRRRAYATLLAVVGIAVVGLWWIRRRIKGN